MTTPTSYPPTRYPPARVSRYRLDAFARRTGLHRGQLWFDAADLDTVARIRRLHNDLSLNYAAVGLVLDLLDEIERLQARARTPRG